MHDTDGHGLAHAAVVVIQTYNNNGYVFLMRDTDGHALAHAAVVWHG